MRMTSVHRKLDDSPARRFTKLRLGHFLGAAIDLGHIRLLHRTENGEERQGTGDIRWSESGIRRCDFRKGKEVADSVLEHDGLDPETSNVPENDQ